MRCPRCGSGQIGECPEPMAQGCATAVPLPGLRQAAQRVHRHRAGPGPLPGRRHAVAVLWRLRYRLSLRDLPARRRAVGPLDGLLPSAAQFDLAADVLALRHPQELLDGAADVLRPRRQRHPPGQESRCPSAGKGSRDRRGLLLEPARAPVHRRLHRRAQPCGEDGGRPNVSKDTVFQLSLDCMYVFLFK
jgi:hypothetical protein